MVTSVSVAPGKNGSMGKLARSLLSAADTGLASWIGLWTRFHQKRAAAGANTNPAHSLELPKRREISSEDLRAFEFALEAVRRREEAGVGAEDLAYIERLDGFSRLVDRVGRAFLALSWEPFGFWLGVLAVAIHKQLETIEIGHTIGHAVFDRIPGNDRYFADAWVAETPVDDRLWIECHNHHHAHTNIVQSDRDLHFGPLRLAAGAPYEPQNRQQVLYAIFVYLPFFCITVNLRLTGLYDVIMNLGGRAKPLHHIPDLSARSIGGALKLFLRKTLGYELRQNLARPLLWGFLAPRVFLGAFLADRMRDIYTGISVLCGHTGEDTAWYADGTRARTMGEWYRMQVESTNNFEVPRFLSLLCGGLDRQIEHHLFPHLSTHRLRRIAPEVRAICERHGVDYRTSSWPSRIRKAFAELDRLKEDWVLE